VWIVKSPSPVKSIATELYRNDYRRCNCDTADGSNCEIVNGVNVRASGINSLYPIRREVTCRVTYTQHVTIYIYGCRGNKDRECKVERKRLI
jgi:hypothetical protein